MEEEQKQGATISNECWDMLEDIANHYFIDKSKAAEVAIKACHKLLVEEHADTSNRTIH